MAALRQYFIMIRFKPRAFKDKNFKFASTDLMEGFLHVADDFMLEVFDYLPGEYLISDESTLLDFTDFGSSETSPLWRRIGEIYGIGRHDVPSERLVDIFAEIQARRKVN